MEMFMKIQTLDAPFTANRRRFEHTVRMMRNPRADSDLCADASDDWYSCRHEWDAFC